MIRYGRGTFGSHPPFVGLDKSFISSPGLGMTPATSSSVLRRLRDEDGPIATSDAATLPNDPRVFELSGYIIRRQGRQEEGLRK